MYPLCHKMHFSRKLQKSCKILWPHFNCQHFSQTHSHRQKQVETTATTTTEPNVVVEKDTHITLIGLNRFQARNSVDAKTAGELTSALVNFENDDTSPIAVLYGLGGTFSAGTDLNELERQADGKSFDFLLKHEGSVAPTRRHLRKPVIAGINGFCVGSALELALMCDLRVMEEGAIMGFFNRRFGVPVIDGGTVRLPAMIGYSRALDLIVTGRRIYAAEALQIGLINRLVATGTALGQAVNLAFSIAKFPLASLMQDRQSLHANTYARKAGFRVAQQTEVLGANAQVLREMQEGVQRFKNSKVKGPKTNSWHIKEKNIPEWELEEIAYEKKFAKEKNKKNLFCCSTSVDKVFVSDIFELFLHFNESQLASQTQQRSLC